MLEATGQPMWVVDRDGVIRFANPAALAALGYDSAGGLFGGATGRCSPFPEILELRKHGAHQKQVIVMNTDGFYEGLNTQLERMSNEGFISAALSEHIAYADTPEAAIALVEAAKKPA